MTIWDAITEATAHRMARHRAVHDALTARQKLSDDLDKALAQRRAARADRQRAAGYRRAGDGW